jgi:intergrase/recombinase
MSEHDICQVQIHTLREELQEFKRDVWEHLKEVRESHKIYAETITVLRENVVRLTGLAERQDDKLDAINTELRQLKAHAQDASMPDDRVWYRQFIENKEKFFVYVLVVLLAFSLGIRVEEVVKVFGGMR